MKIKRNHHLFLKLISQHDIWFPKFSSDFIIIKIVWSLHKYRLMEGFPSGSGFKKKKKPSLLTKAGDVKDPSLITG